jgi:AI-2E family transporter
MIFVLIPGLVHAADQIGGKIPQWIDQINKTFGVAIDHGKPPEQINTDLQNRVRDWIQGNAPKILGLANSTAGLVFEFFTIATFTCYFAVGAPKLLRAYLRKIPPERRRRVGFAWDNAIVQTGGYFYSRALPGSPADRQNHGAQWGLGLRRRPRRGAIGGPMGAIVALPVTAPVTVLHQAVCPQVPRRLPVGLRRPGPDPSRYRGGHPDRPRRRGQRTLGQRTYA